jgi:hypothetical protein
VLITYDPVTDNCALVTTAIHLDGDHSTSYDGGSVPLGSLIHDQATVTGIEGIPVTGDITFAFYETGDCTGDSVDAGTVALVDGVAHPSRIAGPLAAGEYGFRATYDPDGNENYLPADSECESLTVTGAAPAALTPRFTG